MRGRHWVLVAIGVLVVAGAITLSLAPGGQGQGTRYIIEPVGGCVASHPVSGGDCYLYVVVPRTRVNVITILRNGELAASYQLPAVGGGSHYPRYTMYTGRSEPVVGGKAYCHLIDRCAGSVHVFENAEYLMSEPLPDTAQPL